MKSDTKSAWLPPTRVTPELKAAAAKLAAKNEKSLGAWVRELVELAISSASKLA